MDDGQDQDLGPQRSTRFARLTVPPQRPLQYKTPLTEVRGVLCCGRFLLATPTHFIGRPLRCTWQVTCPFGLGWLEPRPDLSARAQYARLQQRHHTIFPTPGKRSKPQQRRDLMPERERHRQGRELRYLPAPSARPAPQMPRDPDQPDHHSHSQTAATPGPPFQINSTSNLPSVGSAPSPMRCATHRTAPHRLTIL